MEYTLTIPNWHPVRTNEWAGCHWSKKRKLRVEQESFLRAYSVHQSVPLATGRRAVELRLYGWHSGKFPDRDAYDKLLLDALVNTGLLVNDDDKGLAGRVEVSFFRSREQRTEIILKDRPPRDLPMEEQCSAASKT